ncbi:MAG: hypothetical protein ABIQ18_25340 [Umezawaea sp.]
MTTPVHLRDRKAGRAWFWWVTAGEFGGFAVPAIVGAVNASPPLLVLAGVVEGAVLGWTQAHVLRRVLPDFPVTRWIAATALAAGFAWAVAMGVSANGKQLASLPLAGLVPLAAISGMAVLLSIGGAQWTVLRHHVERAHRWIWATALAWGTALVVFLAVATPLWQPGQGLPLRVLIGVLAGLLMAATMAAITGAAINRLTREPR